MSDSASTVPAYEPKYNQEWTVFEILLTVLICTFLILYARFHWNRRRIYAAARNIPGPTSFPIVGNALSFIGTSAHIYSKLMAVFEAYPEVCRVWFGHRLMYFITGPDDVEILLNHPKALHKERVYSFGRILTGDGLFQAPLDIWKRHRKIITPTFNQRILDNYVDVFGAKAFILTELLENFAGKGEFDLYHWVTNCTVDIFCETALGTKSNVQMEESEFAKYQDKFLEIYIMRMFNIFYHPEFIFKLTKYYKIQSEASDYIKKATAKIVHEKQQNYEKKLQEDESNYQATTGEEKARKGFLDYLIELSRQGEKLTETELCDEVNTFMVAGTDTTSATVCFLLTALGIHQDIQQNVYEEVLDVLGPNKIVEPSDLPKLKYLERVIKESLRLFTIAIIVARAIEDDIQLSSCVIPGTASAVVGIHHLHRNPKYWPDPMRFDPDRFLPKEVAKRHPYTYLAFSGGPRNCIGLKYAMMAVKSITATIVRKYKIHSGYKSIEEIELKANMVLKPVNGFRVSVELRH